LTSIRVASSKRIWRIKMRRGWSTNCSRDTLSWSTFRLARTTQAARWGTRITWRSLWPSRNILFPRDSMSKRLLGWTLLNCLLVFRNDREIVLEWDAAPSGLECYFEEFGFECNFFGCLFPRATRNRCSITTNSRRTTSRNWKWNVWSVTWPFTKGKKYGVRKSKIKKKILVAKL
jgi:hypothetical protein